MDSRYKYVINRCRTSVEQSDFICSQVSELRPSKNQQKEPNYNADKIAK